MAVRPQPDFWQQQELQREASGGDQPQNTPMLVAVRCRPISREETERNEFAIIRIIEDRLVVVLDPNEYDTALQANRSKEKRYAFDYAFDETATQAEIFNKTSRGLIGGVLDGFNASVFAYGATGAGKTYTMLGAIDSPGVMVLTLNDLYRRMRNDPQYAESQFKVTLSYMEIYNEVIKDLLNPTDSTIGLPLNEDPSRGMVVAGITEYEADSASEILQLLHQGNMARAQEPTAANKTSSRSHAILQVTVEQSERTAHTTGLVRYGKLSLIDLAGSERASKTENTGLRLKEGANINRSLLALGNCINALAAGQSHVPYRDSKMTRLLKDSLGGNCRTVMIANVSPGSEQFEETLNSLKYAHRAKSLKTKVSTNTATVAAHIGDYQRIISALRAEIAQLKAAPAPQHAWSAEPHRQHADGGHADGRESAADAAEQQQARALQRAIVQVAAERRKLSQQLDSVHGSLVNLAAAAAADDAPVDDDGQARLQATAATILQRLAANEHVASQLLGAIAERIASPDRLLALQTLFHAQFLQIARAHASYELTVRQSYEDAVASSHELPPRVQRAVQRLHAWRQVRAAGQAHREFDERMAAMPTALEAAAAAAAPAGGGRERADGGHAGGASVARIASEDSLRSHNTGHAPFSLPLLLQNGGGGSSHATAAASASAYTSAAPSGRASPTTVASARSGFGEGALAGAPGSPRFAAGKRRANAPAPLLGGGGGGGGSGPSSPGSARRIVRPPQPPPSQLPHSPGRPLRRAPPPQLQTAPPPSSPGRRFSLLAVASPTGVALRVQPPPPLQLLSPQGARRVLPPSQAQLLSPQGARRVQRPSQSQSQLASPQPARRVVVRGAAAAAPQPPKPPALAAAPRELSPRGRRGSVRDPAAANSNAGGGSLNAFDQAVIARVQFQTGAGVPHWGDMAQDELSDEGTQISFGQEPIEQRRSQPNLATNEAPDLSALKQSMLRRRSLQTGAQRQLLPTPAAAYVQSGQSGQSGQPNFARKLVSGSSAALGGARPVQGNASSYGARQPQPPAAAPNAARRPLPAQSNSGSFVRNSSRSALNGAQQQPQPQPQPQQVRRIAPAYSAPPKGAPQPQRPTAPRGGGGGGYSSGSGGSVHQQPAWGAALPQR